MSEAPGEKFKAPRHCLLRHTLSEKDNHHHGLGLEINRRGSLSTWSQPGRRDGAHRATLAIAFGMMDVGRFALRRSFFFIAQPFFLRDRVLYGISIVYIWQTPEHRSSPTRYLIIESEV
jgi:hypothetical protein